MSLYATPVHPILCGVLRSLEEGGPFVVAGSPETDSIQ